MRLSPVRGVRRALAGVLASGFLVAGSLHGQSTWTGTDIGTTGAAGTYSFSSGTGTLMGAGAGVSGTADSCSFAYTPATGNVEIITKVWSQSNTSSYATAGLMIRQSTSADAPEAYVSVSPQNGVNFTWRAATGGTSVTTLGPSLAAPVWLRIVKSGSSIAGYQSADGVAWSLVGSGTPAVSGTFAMGLAVSSNVSGTLSAGTFAPIVPMVNVPQRSASMQLWLRGDAGVVLSGTSRVSQWTDQSTYGYNAVQTGTGSQPTLTQGALNSLPSVSFNGSSQYMQFPAGLADFTAGASVFVVTKPTAAVNNARFIEFSNGAASNNLTLARSGTTANSILYSYSAGTISSVTGTNGLTLSQYQLVEAVHSGTGSATVYANSGLVGSGTLFNVTNVARTLNFLGVSSGTTSGFFQGDMVEVLVYNSALSMADRQGIEIYLAKKYGLTSALPAVTAPVFNLATMLYGGPQTLTMTSQAGASIYYTLDGSTPTPSSTPYTGPITISTTGTVNAIATMPNFTNSGVSSVVVTIDASTTGIPRGGMALWLRSDLGLSVSGSSVSQWNDQSGSGNHATQGTGANQPTLVANQLNGRSILRFDGTADWLSIADSSSLKPNQITIFAVAKYAGGGSNAGTIISKSSASNWTNGYALARALSSAFMFVNNQATGGYVTIPWTVNTYSIVEGSYDLQQVKAALVGGVSGTAAYTTALNNTTSVASLGSTAGADWLQGDIAEVLLYGRALSDQEKLAVESYLQQRYLLGYPAVVAPTFSDTSGTTFSQPSQVALTIPAIPSGATIYYTTDGAAPTTSSAVYNGPIWVTYTSTIKAFATAPGYTSSGTVSGTFNLSGTAWPAPTPGGTPPQIYLQLPTNTNPYP